MADQQALEVRFNLNCDAPGLIGQDVVNSDLHASGANLLMRYVDDAANSSQRLLGGAQDRWRVEAPVTGFNTFADFTWQGAGHLFQGWDHLLLILGLALIVRGLRKLVWTLAAFTLGHSLSLSALALGWISVNSALTEFAIALPLLWLACEAAGLCDWSGIGVLVH